VAFRDAQRAVSFPVWADSPWAVDCRERWTPGDCYKLRAVYRETNYGPQLEIRKIRAVTAADAEDGFTPDMFLPRSRFDPAEMFDQLVAVVQENVRQPALANLVLSILHDHRDALLTLPAATRNHHAFAGGYLEHVLSVTRTCVYLSDKYVQQYPDMQPPLSKDLVVAGGALHDIGKLRELAWKPTGAEYTSAGKLVGHILQGRDIIREAAQDAGIEEETLLRLEHIIISHQRLPEWGSPKPPMTPEALLVHYADDCDAKFQMMYAALGDSPPGQAFTSNKNALYQSIYRGEQADTEAG
jgi:3'-5' exoribonuclease